MLNYLSPAPLKTLNTVFSSHDTGPRKEFLVSTHRQLVHSCHTNQFIRMWGKHSIWYTLKVLSRNKLSLIYPSTSSSCLIYLAFSIPWENMARKFFFSPTRNTLTVIVSWNTCSLYQLLMVALGRVILTSLSSMLVNHCSSRRELFFVNWIPKLELFALAWKVIQQSKLVTSIPVEIVTYLLNWSTRKEETFCTAVTMYTVTYWNQRKQEAGEHSSWYLSWIKNYTFGLRREICLINSLDWTQLLPTFIKIWTPRHLKNLTSVDSRNRSEKRFINLTWATAKWAPCFDAVSLSLVIWSLMSSNHSSLLFQARVKLILHINWLNMLTCMLDQLSTWYTIHWHTCSERVLLCCLTSQLWCRRHSWWRTVLARYHLSRNLVNHLCPVQFPLTSVTLALTKEHLAILSCQFETVAYHTRHLPFQRRWLITMTPMKMTPLALIHPSVVCQKKVNRRPFNNEHDIFSSIICFPFPSIFPPSFLSSVLDRHTNSSCYSFASVSLSRCSLLMLFIFKNI